MTSSWIYLIAASVLLLIGIGLLLSLRRERDELAALADFQGQKLAGEWQQGVALADQAAEKLPLGKLRWHFRWAQMNGAYKGQTIGRILMIVLLYGTFGALLPLWNPAPVSLLVPVLAAGMPLATLQRKGTTGAPKSGAGDARGGGVGGGRISSGQRSGGSPWTGSQAAGALVGLDPGSHRCHARERDATI